MIFFHKISNTDFDLETILAKLAKLFTTHLDKTMDITLPKKTEGRQSDMLTDAHQVTIIGANGSGKSRFCDEIINQCQGRAYRISALRAIYGTARHNRLAGSIDERFDRINEQNPMMKFGASTEFERLTYLMLFDEFLDLMSFKTQKLMGEDSPFPKTKLDATVKRWQEVFPKNRVLRENGKLLFSTEGSHDRYSSLRLSDGEKAVLYYIGSVLYAMEGAVIFVDDPETFLHPSIMSTLWNVIEQMRPDCTFVYNTHDLGFASTRIDNRCVWVKGFVPEKAEWDYEVLKPGDDYSDALSIELLGSRKPILFVEGDATHSIDSRLYPLIFTDYTVRPLGSCNKVIEAVRTFNDLKRLHHLDSWGIVDRDRRDAKEVQYLRQKKIFVPNVAEIENILMLEDVIKTVASHRHKPAERTFSAVKERVLQMFASEFKQQALMHVRHRVKLEVGKRIDMRFRNISALETHMVDLVNEIKPRDTYEQLCLSFRRYIDNKDYMQVLRVYNQKLMLTTTNVAGLCGLNGKDEYIKEVLKILKGNGKEADTIRNAVKRCFGIDSGKESGGQA